MGHGWTRQYLVGEADIILPDLLAEMIIVIIRLQKFRQLSVMGSYQSDAVPVPQIFQNSPGRPDTLSRIGSPEDLVNSTDRRPLVTQSVKDPAQIPDFPDKIAFPAIKSSFTAIDVITRARGMTKRFASHV